MTYAILIEQLTGKLRDELTEQKDAAEALVQSFEPLPQTVYTLDLRRAHAEDSHRRCILRMGELTTALKALTSAAELVQR